MSWDNIIIIGRKKFVCRDYANALYMQSASIVFVVYYANVVNVELFAINNNV